MCRPLIRVARDVAKAGDTTGFFVGIRRKRGSKEGVELPRLSVILVRNSVMCRADTCAKNIMAPEERLGLQQQP